MSDRQPAIPSALDQLTQQLASATDVQARLWARALYWERVLRAEQRRESREVRHA